jgi:hypothetical protein
MKLGRTNKMGNKLIEFFEFFDFAEKNIYIVNIPSDFTDEEVSVLGSKT